MSDISPAAWAVTLAGLVQFIVVVRYLTLLGAKIDHHRDITTLKIDTVTERVVKLEHKIDVGKVVILRRPKDVDDDDES